MEDSRASKSTFYTLLESPEAETTAIPVVGSEQLPTRRSRDIPVSLQELVYGRKEEGAGTSSKPLDRDNELISLGEKALRGRKDRGPYERLGSNFCERESPIDRNLVQKSKNLSEDTKRYLAQKNYNSPVKAPQAFTSKNIPPQVPKTGKQAPQTNQKGN
ncbi:hypothetical protein O181_001775 [Austropuccinia psidii MF-1]|uniref:Uncharacterized protein n=1 Tax=Austropuccinia psidii MF-1 TaxID=1389203 RepID=A0A9Q3BBQ1_9BASI|nr:hypothetical protein [Austropuccinia psidii MF-1]